MGVDISISIVKDGKYVVDKYGNDVKNWFKGRNSEWFDNLQGGYDYFPKKYDLKEIALPKDIEADYNTEYTYYGWTAIEVGDFWNWVEKYKPELDAGWITAHDKWKYEVRGIIPEEISYYYDKEYMSEKDYSFIEIENLNEPSYKLYTFIWSNKIPKDAFIVYYFDC